MKKVFKSPYVWILVFYLAAMLFLADGIRYLLYVTGVHFNSDSYTSYSEFVNKEIRLSYFVGFGEQILFGIAVWFLAFKTKWFERRKVDFRKKDILYSIYAFLIKMVVSMVAGIVFYLLKVKLESSTANQDVLNDFINSYAFMGIVFTVILAPIIEEFIFRKVMIGHIFKNHKYIGLIVSSFLFGSLHLVAGFSWFGLVIYSSLGFILGWIYIKTERIEASTTAHIFNNFISVIISLLAK
ncbi:CPBP family intramembrane glutamic endopeptidase [Priestia filamentosa]|uniref:CPBP family intramembrane glutamic endopeptidase n=1 Tax=Priestia filamentosa TaxID=1402861 RepID=UPI0005892A26